MFLGIHPIFVLENSWDHASKSFCHTCGRSEKPRNKQSRTHEPIKTLSGQKGGVQKHINKYLAEGPWVPQHLQDKLEGIENGLSSCGKLRERSKPSC